MTPIKGELPRRPQTNPEKLHELAQGYSARALATSVMLPMVMTLVAEVVTRLSTGSWSPSGTTGLVVPWLLALLPVPALLRARQVMTRATPRKIPVATWIHDQIQLVWLWTLAWYSTPLFAPVIFFALCAGVFNDIRYLYDSAAIRFQYAGSFLVYLLLLLFVDLLGGEGLVRRAEADLGYVYSALIVQGSVAVLLQIIIVIAGRKWYESELQSHANQLLRSQLAAAERERSVMLHACDFVEHGIHAAQFSHDIASPISTQRITVDQILELLGVFSSTPLSPAQQHTVAQLHKYCMRLDDALRITHTMTRELLESIRAPKSSTNIEIRVLITEAIRQAQGTVGAKGRPALDPSVNLEPALVVAVPEHSSALATVIQNGMRESPDSALEIVGRFSTQCTYELQIRDFGVDGVARTEALARIEQSLSLESSENAAPPPSEHGYGKGLLLAKIMLLRHDGSIRVFPAPLGPGIVFEISFSMFADQDVPPNTSPLD